MKRPALLLAEVMAFAALVLAACDQYTMEELPPPVRSTWALTMTDTAGRSVDATLSLLLQETDEGLRTRISVLASGRLDYAGVTVEFPPFLNALDTLESRGHMEAMSWANGLTGTGCFLVFVSAHGTIFVMTWDGLFRSTDGGATWRSADAATDPVHSLAEMCESDSRLFLANDRTIWRSDDDGASWTTVLTESRQLYVGSIAAGPGGRVYAGNWGYYTGSRECLLRSDDAGSSWIHMSVPGITIIDRLRVDPRGRLWIVGRPGEQYMREDERVYVSGEDGTTFRHVTHFTSTIPCQSVDFAFVGRDTVYAATFKEATKSLHRSVDGGETWVTLWSAPAARNSGVTIVCERDGTIDIGADGVYISYTGGTSFWEHSMWYSYAAAALGRQVADIALGPDGRLWVASSVLLRRGEDGRSWVRCNGRVMHVFDYTITGNTIQGSDLRASEQTLDSTMVTFVGTRR